MNELFERRLMLPGRSAADLERYHARPAALERLTPPWERVRLVSPPADGSRPGTRVVIETRLGPVPLRWVARVLPLDVPGERGFRDVQDSGPFALWDHRHLFLEHAQGAELVDRVEYRLPFAPLARPLLGGFTRAKLERLFAWRHEVTGGDIARMAEGGQRPAVVALLGDDGPFAAALAAFLAVAGCRVERGAPAASHADAVITLGRPSSLGSSARASFALERPPLLVRGEPSTWRAFNEAIHALDRALCG